MPTKKIIVNLTMKNAILILASLFITFFAQAQVSADVQKSLNDEVLEPNSIYEIRYWQDLSRPGNADIFLDTMKYQRGNDRAGFAYSNAECVSFHCKETDDMVYSLVPKFSGTQDEWTIKEKFIRKLQSTPVPFRSMQRSIHMVYVADKGTEMSGYGDYSMVSKEFGVVSRWNGDGEFYQLLRIDVYETDSNTNPRLQQEIDLLPLHDQMMQKGAYRLRK